MRRGRYHNERPLWHPLSGLFYSLPHSAVKTFPGRDGDGLALLSGLWPCFPFGLFLLISRDGGEYLHRVVFQPDLDVMNNEGQRWDYFYYFLPGILYTMPVILFLPLAIVDLRRRGYSAPLAIAGAIFVVISFVHQKRTHYLLPLYPFLALGISSCLVHYREKMPIVKKGMWIVIPLSIAVTPVYFAIIQPISHPAADLDMVISRETLRVIEPDAIVYCVKSDEALAWVGKQHKRVHKVPPRRAVLRAFPGTGKAAYILTDDKNLKILFNTTGQPPTRPSSSAVTGMKKDAFTA